MPCPTCSGASRHSVSSSSRSCWKSWTTTGERRSTSSPWESSALPSFGKCWARSAPRLSTWPKCRPRPAAPFHPFFATESSGFWPLASSAIRLHGPPSPFSGQPSCWSSTASKELTSGIVIAIGGGVSSVAGIAVGLLTNRDRQEARHLVVVWGGDGGDPGRLPVDGFLWLAGAADRSKRHSLDILPHHPLDPISASGNQAP